MNKATTKDLARAFGNAMLAAGFLTSLLDNLSSFQRSFVAP